MRAVSVLLALGGVFAPLYLLDLPSFLPSALASADNPLAFSEHEGIALSLLYPRRGSGAVVSYTFGTVCPEGTMQGTNTTTASPAHRLCQRATDELVVNVRSIPSSGRERGFD